MRRRLTTEQRRLELIRSAAQLLGTRPYEDVSIDEIAEHAGASRALLYHYFPSKQELAREVVQHESTALRAAIEGQDLPAALAAYLDYVESHPDGYRLLHEGALRLDSEIRGVISESREHVERIVLELLGTTNPGPAARLAVRGWTGFVIAICLEWINDSGIDRRTVEAILTRSLDQLVHSA
ncbi:MULTISPECIES: TetR/AcrR family transcriptional regulator [unclassified Cryobacterium]|uniref:TetR family transcriptional regulator n=1 Tax=unclassified Cryobacterium TaxID=2649013 RepID=UPI001446DBDF